MAVPTFALPGDPLAPATTHLPGPGTHTSSSTIFSSLAGTVSSSAPASKKSATNPHPTLTTTPPPTPHAPALPTVGTIVLGRITRTQPRQASLSILALGPNGATVLREPLNAIIRVQDIRATEVDKVKMSESFRVGDVVRALVISLGDERAYYVGTAGNEFGVVLARSEAGERLVPVSWREMVEVGGVGAREARKVAKPI